MRFTVGKAIGEQFIIKLQKIVIDAFRNTVQMLIMPSTKLSYDLYVSKQVEKNLQEVITVDGTSDDRAAFYF